MEKRNFDLSSRAEDTIDKKPVAVVRFKLNEIRKHFNESIEEIKKQFLVAKDLIKNGKDNEAKNVWRSQVIFLESAFDFYLHEITKYGLCEIFSGNWEKTDKYENIEVKMKVIEDVLKAREDTDWFLEFVNSCYIKVTMVSYESVKDQMNLLGMDVRNIADRAFHTIGATEKTKDKLKRRLNELFTRRNIIAHQSDRKHSDAQINDISEDVVNEFLIDTEKIVKAIYDEAIENGKKV